MKTRPKYLNQIYPFLNKDIIKVFVGQRRVGKSKLLLQTMDELKQQGVREEDIVYIDKENLSFDHIQDYQTLYSTVKSYTHIFIDEVQYIAGREKAILSLQGEGKDIYITGSNADLLSSDLATRLRGRYVQITVYPLDYQEFIDFHDMQADTETFETYMTFGGMPYLINLPLEEEIVYQYLKSLGNAIILKDIIERFSIRNAAIFNKLITYMAKTIGNIFSSPNIAAFLKHEKLSLTPATILGYVQYLMSAYVIQEGVRYNILGKKIFEIKQKYYFTDIGIRNALVGGFQSVDRGGILENVVFCNLISHGRIVKIGEIEGKEVDFVCEKDGKIIYLQVAYLLQTDDTIEREFSSLLAIRDSRPKYVLSMDPGASGVREGVERKNVSEFLLGL